MTEKHFIHNSSIVDEKVTIGKNTKIWHFCHISEGVKIGKKLCNWPKCFYWKKMLELEIM